MNRPLPLRPEAPFTASVHVFQVSAPHGSGGSASRAAEMKSRSASATTGVEWERQPLRIPEFGKAFRNALHQHPRQASAAAISAAGRLAAGDPSIWKTVRALRMRPGTLRVRIAGEYRLLFETGPGDTLHLIDLILRRDLDRWLAGGGH